MEQLQLPVLAQSDVDHLHTRQDTRLEQVLAVTEHYFDYIVTVKLDLEQINEVDSPSESKGHSERYTYSIRWPSHGCSGGGNVPTEA
jgi:hypothetical protein